MKEIDKKHNNTKYGYAYTDEMFDKASELIETKVVSSPTQAAKVVCKEAGVEYNESIGRTYRKHFNGSNLLINSVGYKEAQERELPKSNIYFLSSAQNNTPTNKKLLRNMEAYADKIGASIGIIASRYRNPNLYDEGMKDNYWDKTIEKYLIASRYRLHKNLIIGADVFVPYTTKRPLTVARNMSRDFSFVVGHPKQEFESVPTLDGIPDKYLYSTGSVSLPLNYSKTMAGATAQKDHKQGFIIVMITEEGLKVRNVEADVNGNFQDLTVKVEGGKVLKDKGTIETMVLGDLHTLYEDKEAEEKTDRLIEILSPKEVVLHDVLSAESISFFTRKDIFKKIELMDKGTDSLEEEINASIDVIGKYRKFSKVIIPRANHHNFVDQWVTREDWKKDPTNARTFLELASLKANPNLNSDKGLYALIVDTHFKGKEGNEVVTLSYDESYRTKGIEISQHGDKGSDGRRGSPVQYEKTGIPHIVAHRHTPEKRGDVLVVGTNTKRRMGYNMGYSGWRPLHGAITENGKIQYIQI